MWTMILEEIKYIHVMNIKTPWNTWTVAHNQEDNPGKDGRLHHESILGRKDW